MRPRYILASTCTPLSVFQCLGDRRYDIHQILERHRRRTVHRVLRVPEGRKEGSRGWSNAEPPDPVSEKKSRPGVAIVALAKMAGGARRFRMRDTGPKASAAPPGRRRFRVAKTGRSAALHTRLPSERASGTPSRNPRLSLCHSGLLTRRWGSFRGYRHGRRAQSLACDFKSDGACFLG